MLTSKQVKPFSMLMRCLVSVIDSIWRDADLGVRADGKSAFIADSSSVLTLMEDTGDGVPPLQQTRDTTIVFFETSVTLAPHSDTKKRASAELQRSANARKF